MVKVVIGIVVGLVVGVCGTLWWTGQTLKFPPVPPNATQGLPPPSGTQAFPPSSGTQTK